MSKHSDKSEPNRPERPGGPLTRETILRTALEIVDDQGVDALSMRRLGDALGRDPVTLYRHVPSKSALLDGVAETVLAQLAVEPEDPNWQSQLRAVAHNFRQIALQHPNTVPLLVTRPLSTPLGQRPPGMLRPLEAILKMLTAAGFSGEDALHTYRVLFGYLHGHILNELQEIIERPEETDHVLQLGLHRLPITDFPHLRALAPVLASYDGASELDRGLDLLLPGLNPTSGQPDRPDRTTGNKAPHHEVPHRSPARRRTKGPT